MSKLDFRTVEIAGDQRIFGFVERSNDRTQARDISLLTKMYRDAVGKSGEAALPFYVLSRDYDMRTKNFTLFIGGLPAQEPLEAHTILPQGTYVRVTVKPKLGFLWGAAIGEAKRAFYTRWILRSSYAPLNMEYEYHTERSMGKHPEIDIFFAVEKPS